MLVGFDATTIRGNKTGVGYYTARLLERLTVVDGNDNPIDHLAVLSNLEVPLSPELPRVTVHEHGRFGVRAVWMQGVLPFILRRLRPDLCHFTNFLAPVWVDTPFVVTFHDMSLQLMPRYHTVKKRLLTASLMPVVAGMARLIITPSVSAKEDVARILGVSRDKIRAIPHAPDPLFRPVRTAESFERVQRTYGLRKPYLLYVGTLEPRKNITRALEAFARLGHEFRDHFFYLAGDLGWHYRPVLRTIRELGLHRRVKRLGYVEERDLPVLYSHADLFVYPSLYEGFGLPVVEAMACGAPVLTSNTSSLAELAGGAALLADPRDVGDLTEVMERALASEAERRRWAARGLERAASFTWDRTARATLAVYEEAVERATVRVRAPGKRLSEAAVHPTASDARAVVETIRYGSLFHYPVKLEEIHRGLLGVALRREQIESLLASHPAVRTQIDRRGLYYFVRGRAHEIAERWSREGATQQLLRRHQRHLDLVCSTPFVRMVALSGATAHGTASDGDIDLFLITAPKRAWAVSLLLMVGAKLMGVRRVICVNYLVSEDRLAITEHDPFTAHQIVSLKPLTGFDVYYRFVRANDWGALYYPNFWRHFREYASCTGGRCHAGSRRLEAALGWGGGWWIEQVARHVLGGYLHRKRRGARSPASVKLEPTRIKLHFNDNGNPLNARLEEALAKIAAEREMVGDRVRETLG